MTKIIIHFCWNKIAGLHVISFVPRILVFLSPFFYITSSPIIFSVPTFLIPLFTGFGYHNFDWNAYIEQQNRDTLVIPMAEDYEFTDNIDEILAVPGIDAVNFGPIDYAVSRQLKIGYSMGEEVHDAYKVLVEKCKAKGIGVLGPVVPPTKENLKNAIADGYTMIILGNDMWHFQKALKELVSDAVEPVREEMT